MTSPGSSALSRTFGLRLLLRRDVQAVAIGVFLGLALLQRLIEFVVFSAGEPWAFDFSSYWSAGLFVVDGRPIYADFQLAGPYVPQGRHLYTYPPLLAVLASPLAATFDSFRSAHVIWAGLGLSIAVATVVSVARIEGRWSWPTVGLALAVVAAFPAIVSELINGNVHLELLGLFTLAWFALRRGSRAGDLLAGAAVGLGVMIKIFPIVVVGWFLLAGRRHAVLGSIIGAAISVAITLPFVGIDPWLDYPTVLLNLGRSSDTTDTLGPTAWLSEVLDFTVARSIVTMAGVAVVAWSVRHTATPISFAIAAWVSVLIAPAVYHHYLALAVLPLMLGFIHGSPRWLLLASYLLMFGGDQPLLGDFAWVVNRALPSLGMVALLGALLAARPSDGLVDGGDTAHRPLWWARRRRTVPLPRVRQQIVGEGGSMVGARRLKQRSITVALVTALCFVAPLSVTAAPPDVGADRVKALITFRERPGAAAEASISAAGGSIRFRYDIIPTLAVEIPARAIDRLRRNPLVAAVEVDHKLVALDHVTVDTGDLEYENAWGVEHIGTKSAHDANVRGQSVRVAVIDTGIDYIHQDPDDDPYVVDPEFNSNYRGGYDFVNNDADPYDDNGHGTHVSGILAAEKNGYLVVGVAPAVDLFSLKVLGPTGEGDYSGLIAALNWAVLNDIHVVNMSIGGHEVSAALQAAIEAAAAAGIVLVAASGNTVTFWELWFGCPVVYPAAYPQVLSTTFTNGDDALTGLSCTGPEVDFAAPGDQIFSPVPTGTCMFCTPYGYAAQSGTSMASPHLAGTVALLLSGGLTDTGPAGLVDDVRARLCATADVGFGVLTTPIPTTDPRYAQYFGCGVINAGAAVAGLTPPGDNALPVAGADTLTTDEDTAADVDVLTNDTDADLDQLTVTAVTDPAHGTASINAGGSLHYVPDADFFGSDAFTYTIADGNGGTAVGTVGVTVDPVNDQPIAVNDSASTAYQTSVEVAVLANDSDVDGDGLTITQASTPGAGSAVVDGSLVRYTPNAGFTGFDAFTYTVSDGAGGSASATVTVSVGSPPVVNAFHIGDLDGSRTFNKNQWTARVTIRVETAGHVPLSGVVVTGSWSVGGTSSCTTNTNGVCTVQKTKLSRATVASVTFTVTNGTRSGWTYISAHNHDGDTPADSTGTAITILRP